MAYFMSSNKELDMSNENDFFDDGLEGIGETVPARKPTDPSVRGEGYVPPTTFTNIPRGKSSTVHVEKCPACRGTGRFYSWSGRDCGECFKCKGKGERTFKSSSADRAKSREQASARKEAKLADALVAFQAEFAAEHAWLVETDRKQRWNAQQGKTVWSFPGDLLVKIQQYGSLTDGQIAAVRKFMLRDAGRKTEAQKRIDNAKSVDVSKIEQAFAHARGDAAKDGEGVKWLKLNLDTFKFSDAPANGQWPAAIFVREGENKLGRIVGGKFIRSFACDDPTEARVIAAASDPAAAAKAYGLRTGSCSCCGRELTNAESRAAGIGPICAQKHGW